MNVFESVQTVLAVRDFQDKPIEAALVDEIVEAGRLTASGSNGQPWHFVVVEDREALRRLGELAKTGPYIAKASVAIVVVVNAGDIGISDGSRAIQSMILTAWSHGIGSNWVGFSGRLAEINGFLDIPADQNVLAVLPFGYPVKAIGQGLKKRKPLAEVAFRGKFGQPYR